MHVPLWVGIFAHMKKNQSHLQPAGSVVLPLEEYRRLLDQVDSLKKAQQAILNEQLENGRLRNLVAQLQRLCWGRSSEKRRLPEDPDQLRICFDTPQGVDPTKVEERKREEVDGEKKYNRFRKTFKKKPSPHSRQPLPAHIERIKEVLEPELDLTGAVRIGEEVTERYALRPSQFYIEQLVRPRYKLTDGRIVIAPLPAMAHPRSNASESVLAHIAVAKYADHLPLNRQIDIFTREGINLAASTVSNWMMATAQCIEPIYNELRETLKASEYVQADETPHKVLESDKAGALHNGYMWAFYLPHCKSPYFEYHQGRGSSALGTLLSGRTRIVQSDGFSAYKIFDELSGYLHLCCWAHVRRKFVEAENYAPIQVRHVLDEIGKLYRVEQEIREKSLKGEEIVRLRQEKSYPLIKALEQWAQQHLTSTPKGSPLEKAVVYMYTRFEQLSHYVNDARLAIDNNAVERSIRPLTLNRKNCLFSGSHDAAHAAAIFYSLLGSCKENNVNPEKWLKECLTKVKECDPKDYSKLLPHHWKEQN